MFALNRNRKLLILLCLCTVALFACQKSTVDVNLHGVDYSGSEFSYSVVDPANPNKISGGEHIDPFSGGGITCCATLPKKWRPGIKLEIRTTHWLPKKEGDENLPEVHEVHIVEIPPYVDGKPGELWVLREAGGKVSVVSSEFQPDHPKWPGKVKGWPVPSREYMLERWELYRHHEEVGVRLYESLLDELKEDPQKRATESWKFAEEYEKAKLKGFSGPDDPAYREKLRKEYEEGLVYSKNLLKQVMDAKP